MLQVVVVVPATHIAVVVRVSAYGLCHLSRRRKATKQSQLHEHEHEPYVCLNRPPMPRCTRRLVQDPPLFLWLGRQGHEQTRKISLPISSNYAYNVSDYTITTSVTAIASSRCLQRAPTCHSRNKQRGKKAVHAVHVVHGGARRMESKRKMYRAAPVPASVERARRVLPQGQLVTPARAIPGMRVMAATPTSVPRNVYGVESPARPSASAGPSGASGRGGSAT